MSHVRINMEGHDGLIFGGMEGRVHDLLHTLVLLTANVILENTEPEDRTEAVAAVSVDLFNSVKSGAPQGKNLIVKEVPADD